MPAVIEYATRPTCPECGVLVRAGQGRCACGWTRWITIRYIRPRYDPDGLDSYLPRLRYPRMLWSRAAAWADAEQRGGYAKVHDGEFWAYTYEPEHERAPHRRRRD